MSGYRQRLFAVLADGAMTYPVFVEVAKNAAEVDLDLLRREIAAQYGLEAKSLQVVCHPRWAIRRDTAEGHVVHLGMIPTDSPPADS